MVPRFLTFDVAFPRGRVRLNMSGRMTVKPSRPVSHPWMIEPPPPPPKRYRNGVIVDGNMLTDDQCRLVGYFREETFRAYDLPKPPKQPRDPGVRLHAGRSIYLNVTGGDHLAKGLHGWLSPRRFSRAIRNLALA